MRISDWSLDVCSSDLGLSHAAGISDNVIRIGFITDMSGVYSDIDGKAGADAVRMAIADAGGEIDGKKIELFVADHQTKADIGSERARQWFAEKNMDVLIGGKTSRTETRSGEKGGGRQGEYEGG